MILKITYRYCPCYFKFVKRYIVDLSKRLLYSYESLIGKLDVFCWLSAISMLFWTG